MPEDKKTEMETGKENEPSTSTVKGDYPFGGGGKFKPGFGKASPQKQDEDEKEKYTPPLARDYSKGDKEVEENNDTEDKSESFDYDSLSDEDKKAYDNLKEDNKDASDEDIAKLFKDSKESSDSEEAKNDGFDIDSVIKEKTKGKYSSFDDVLSKIDEYEFSEGSKPSFKVSEAIKSIDEKVKDKYGVNLNEAIRLSSLNIDDMGEDEIVVEAMNIDDPGITQEEIDSKMRKFDLLFDSEAQSEYIENSDNESQAKRHIDDLMAEWKGILRKSKKSVGEYKDKINLDDLSIGSESDQKEELTEEEKKQQLEKQEQINKAFENTVSSLGEETFKITDKDGNEIDSVVLNVDDDIRSSVKEKVLDGEYFIKRWLNEDGTPNNDKVVEDVLVTEYLPLLLKSTYDQGKSVGAKEGAESIENPSFNSTKSPRKGVSSDIKSQMAEASRRIHGG